MGHGQADADQRQDGDGDQPVQHDRHRGVALVHDRRPRAPGSQLCSKAALMIRSTSSPISGRSVFMPKSLRLILPLTSKPAVYFSSSILVPAPLNLTSSVTGLVTPRRVRLPVTSAAAWLVSTTLSALKTISGNCAASNQGASFSSPSSLALLVEIESTGIWISSVLWPTDFGFRSRLPLTLVNSPYQVVKPICEMLNSTRVCDGSTP